MPGPSLARLLAAVIILAAMIAAVIAVPGAFLARAGRPRIA